MIRLASAVPRGPVHCNLPFREPLIPAAGDGPTAGPPRHDSVRRMPAEDDIARWAAAIGGAQRGLIVCGPLDDAASARAIARLSAVSGFPLFADPLSQLRGEAGAGQGIDVYDAIIRSEAGRTLEPDLILRFGAALTSKATQEWLAARSRRGVAHLVALGDHEWPDPSTAAADTIEAAPDAIAALLAGARAASSGSPLSAWPELWRRLAATARGAIDEALAGASEISEPGVIRALDAVLPQGAALILGNSMPVRDADSFLVASRRPLRVFANRGANGIDGVVSTACGIAAAGVSPAVLVVGDISFYHDLNGLLALRRYDLPLTIVVVNNDGGGIFHFLPQAEAVPEFEPLFGTPHGLRFAHAAELYGIPYAAPADDAALRRELQREGIAARAYFRGFRWMVRADRAAFTPDGRTRRPPRDRANAGPRSSAPPAATTATSTSSSKSPTPTSTPTTPASPPPWTPTTVSRRSSSSPPSSAAPSATRQTPATPAPSPAPSHGSPLSPNPASGGRARPPPSMGAVATHSPPSTRATSDSKRD